MSDSRVWGRTWPKLRAAAARLLRPGENVLVAVSGGPDSVCLAHALWLLSQRRPLRLHLAYIHHGLRREADAEAEFVRDLGARWGLPVTIKRVTVQGKRGMEDAARKARYRALEELALRFHCRAVATGHQLDDQAETVLLHLLRGVDPKGLAGMPESRPLSPGSRIRLVRPLLSVSRAEVAAYLKHHALRWRTDGSNSSEELTRNWVRRKVLPLLEKRNPRVREHLADMASLIRKEGFSRLS